MKVFYVFLLTFTIIISGFSQSTTNSAREHIKNLKNGTLLVRLEDKARKVEYYEKNGNSVLAEKIQNKLDEKNQLIIESFEEEFDFTEYYFFFMKDSKEVLNKQDYSSVFRKDQKDNSLPSPDTDIYVCTIDQGIIEKERALNHPGYQIYNIEEEGNKQVFTRLDKPFPNGAKFKLPFSPPKKFIPAEVKRLNRDLHKFYKSN